MIIFFKISVLQSIWHFLLPSPRTGKVHWIRVQISFSRRLRIDMHYNRLGGWIRDSSEIKNKILIMKKQTTEHTAWRWAVTWNTMKESVTFTSAAPVLPFHEMPGEIFALRFYINVFRYCVYIFLWRCDNYVMTRGIIITVLIVDPW